MAVMYLHPMNCAVWGRCEGVWLLHLLTVKGAVSRCSASLLVVPSLALCWSRVCWHFHIEGVVGIYSIKASNDNTSQPQELEVHLEIGRTLLPKKLVPDILFLCI